MRRVVLLALVVMVSILVVPAILGAQEGKKTERTERSSTPAPRALGAASGELGYVPIAPCRVADTRAAGGAFAAGEVRSFVVAGADGFAAQGGKAGGCDIPDGAVTVDFAFTAVDPPGKGFFRMWPFGGAEPQATLLNYSSALNATNSAAVAICDPAEGPCASDLSVKNFASSSHLVIDVTGYYVEPLFALVAADGTLTTGSRVVSVTKIGIGEYDVEFDRDVSTCAVSAIIGDADAEAAGLIDVGNLGVSDAIVTIFTQDPDGLPPPLADRGFQIVVTC